MSLPESGAWKSPVGTQNPSSWICHSLEMPDMDPNEARGQLQAAGRYMLANDLAWGNTGNISARLGPEQYIITASGTRLGELEDDDFVECSFDGPLPGSRKPSKETPMHRAIYQRVPRSVRSCTPRLFTAPWLRVRIFRFQRTGLLRICTISSGLSTWITFIRVQPSWVRLSARRLGGP